MLLLILLLLLLLLLCLLLLLWYLVGIIDRLHVVVVVAGDIGQGHGLLAQQRVVPVLVVAQGLVGDDVVLAYSHALGVAAEVGKKLLAGEVFVEAYIVPGVGRSGEHASHLHDGGIAAGGHIDTGVFRLLVPLQLELRHGVVGGLEPQHVLRLLERPASEVGYPQAFRAVAALGLALETGAVTAYLAALLESHHSLFVGDGQREREAGVDKAILPGLGGQEEIILEHGLRRMGDAARAEVAVEDFLAELVGRREPPYLIVGQVEGLGVPVGDDDP